MIDARESLQSENPAKRYAAVALPLALLAIPMLWFFTGGVIIAAANRSASTIDELKVGCGQGAVVFESLPPGAIWTKRLGRIGDGATFLIDVGTGRDRLKYRAEVYFEPYLFRTTVFFEVGDDRGVEFHNGQRVRKAIALP